MLKVKTYLDRSKIHGIGLFSDQIISTGQEVWSFHPKIDLVIEPDEWLTMEREVAEASFSQIRRLAYKENGKIHLCLDNAQFMNHSRILNNITNLKDTNTMIATRQIEVGEELLCNYFEFCDQDDVIQLVGLSEMNQHQRVSFSGN